MPSLARENTSIMHCTYTNAHAKTGTPRNNKLTSEAPRGWGVLVGSTGEKAGNVWGSEWGERPVVSR